MGDSTIDIRSEVEIPNGWRFECAVASQPDRVFDFTLDWTTYELWSRGAVPPAQIARETIDFLMRSDDWPPNEDHLVAARLRRLHPALDAALTNDPPAAPQV